MIYSHIRRKTIRKEQFDKQNIDLALDEEGLDLRIETCGN